MTIQNYLIIENNVVTNVIYWDGNLQTWTAPVDSIQLVQETTPAMTWISPYGLIPPKYTLTESIGIGGIGFTWDGSVLTTNEPQPTPPKEAPDQPTTSGTTTI